MSHPRVKAVVALVLMALAFIGSLAWKPTTFLADLRPKVSIEQLFPSQIGAWRQDASGPTQLVAPDQAALLAKIYSQTLSRTYVDASGNRIMLSVAYGGDQSDATRAHRPEVCYPAQGFNVSGIAERRLNLGGLTLRARQLVANQGGRTEPITYWIVVGDKAVLGGPEQKYAQLAYTTRGIIPDGMLVRVSNISTNSAESFELHRQFLMALIQQTRPEYVSRIVGSQTQAVSARPADSVVAAVGTHGG